MDLPVLPTVSDCLKYLRTQPLGTQCVLTGGNRLSVRGQFKSRGAQVSVIGPLGKRLISVKKWTNEKKISNKEYNSSGTDDLTWKTNETLHRGVKAGVPVFVQGHLTTIRRQLSKYIGAGNYSVKQKLDDPRGKGWTVISKQDFKL